MNEEKVIQMLLKHEEDIEYIKENMATKNDVRRISDTLDTLVSFAKKKDQEITMIAHGTRRLSDEIERIKPLVGLAS